MFYSIKNRILTSQVAAAALFVLFAGPSGVAAANESILLTATPLSGQPPLTVTFTGTPSSLPYCGNTKTWDFGDGSVVGSADSCAPYSANVAPVASTITHTYLNDGVYVATLKINQTTSNVVAIAVITSANSATTVGGGSVSAPSGGTSGGQTLLPVWTMGGGTSLGNGNTLSRDLSIGVRDADATALQTFLTTTGYYSGPITGYFGSLTRRAVIRFQQANNVPGTGYVGPLTRRAIQRSALPAQQKFRIGDRVITTDQVVVRAVPNIDSKTWEATQPKSVFGTVVEGPVLDTSNMTNRPTPLWFWRIDFDSGVDGWVTDNYLENTSVAGSGCILRPACLDSVPRCLIAEPAGGWCSTVGGGTSAGNGTFCTQEVKQCPDGSYVGRISPMCEFAVCSGSGTTLGGGGTSGGGGPSQLPPAQQKFKVGDRIVTTDRVNVRASASSDSLTWVATQPKGALGSVVNGPIIDTSASTAFWYWQINYDSGVDGWSVENYLQAISSTLGGNSLGY